VDPMNSSGRRLTRQSIAAMDEEVGQLVDQKLDQSLDQKFDNKLSPLTKAIQDLTEKVSLLVNKQQVEDIVNERCAELKQENKELKDRIIYLEAQSRRNNLRFTGINEDKTQTWLDCEKSVQDIAASLGITDAIIERAHRLGPLSQPDSPSRANPRPIICKFLTYKDKDRILQAARTKEGAKALPAGVHVLEDFPPEIEAKRRLLNPYFITARKANAKARLSMDKLTIEGITYTADTVDTIPSQYHPQHTKEVGQNIVAFYTTKSPFSNFYQCQFSQDSVVYTSAEQYLAYQKALVFNDIETANKVIKAVDPARAKALGRRVKGFDSKLWGQRRQEIMREALTLKFDQNPALKEQLAATKNKILVEANPFDKFWGAGLSLYNPKLEKQRDWPGQNVLGKILMELRTSLCG